MLAGFLLGLGGYDPIEAFASMGRGAFGSMDRFLSYTLVRATPLILTGLAVALAFRASVWNIGAEGQLYAGAIAGVAVALALPSLPLILALPMTLTAACAAGALWAAVPALMKVRLGVGEVITTLLMNFVGIYLASYVVHGPLQESRGVFPQTDRIPAAARLPLVGADTRLHLGFFLAVLLCVGLWFVFNRSVVGFRIRAVGASPKAATVSGRMSGSRTILGTFLVSGAIAGLAGWVQVAGVTYSMYEGLSPGWGYTAIAVALLAGLDPLGVILTGIVFGALEAGAGAMQRDAGIPEVWVRGIEAMVILAVLATDRGVRALSERRQSRA